MECRKSFVLALGLLSGVAGCGGRSQQLPVVKSLEPPVPVDSKGTPFPVVEASAPPAEQGPIRQPKATTCVTAGDFYSHEAQSPQRPADARKNLQDHAIKAYQQAMKIDPNHLPAYQGLARLYLSMGQNELAVKTYRQGLDISPDSAPLWFELGMGQLRAKKWDPALSSLTRAVDLDPENSQYINTLGYALARAGRFDDSYVCFCRVNDDAAAHFKVARMARHLQNSSVAREHLQVALKVNPQLKEASALLAELENGQKSPQVETAAHRENAGQNERAVETARGTETPLPQVEPVAAAQVVPEGSSGENGVPDSSGGPLEAPATSSGLPLTLPPAVAAESAPVAPFSQGPADVAGIASAEQPGAPVAPSSPEPTDVTVRTSAKQPLPAPSMPSVILPPPPALSIKYKLPEIKPAAEAGQ